MNPAVFTWIVYALWIILVIYLTLAVTRETQGHLGQSFGLLAAIIASFLLPRLSIFRFLNFAPVNPGLSTIVIFLCVAGMAFLVWARQSLGKNWSQTVAAKVGHELVTTGPYRYVRHPMYAGGLLASLGSALARGGAWVFLLVILGSLFLWRSGRRRQAHGAAIPERIPGLQETEKSPHPFSLVTMKYLNAKAIGGLLALLFVMAAGLFLSAATFDYWQAWVFLAVFGASSLAITLYLMKNDPALLERRVYGGPTAEKETSQKFIQSLTALMFIGMLVVPGLDHRFAWSSVSLYAEGTGDVLVALAFLIIFFVYKENSFTSATIDVYAGQTVISTGLYALVRHPMYVGGLLMFVGMPLALGSWWGLLVLAVMMPALLWRIVDEEKFLTKNLPGYAEYKTKVSWRLIPRVW
jgi:protein-S-isoprenylcysteine O-methyltransferase Ste14